MKRRSSTSGKPLKAGRRKVRALQRPNALKAARPHKSPAAGDEAEVARLRRELNEALEQQTATSEVLKVISSSPGELEPVFKAMLENATRICQAKFGTLFRYDGDRFQVAAGIGTPAALVEFQRKLGPFRPDESSNVLGRLLRQKMVAVVEDEQLNPTPSPPARYGGARSIVAVPMLKDDALVGAFVIYRQEVRPFTDKQISLLTNFAAQAVIVIENVRLLNELRQRTADLSEALEQQTATSDVLKIIGRSAFDLQPIFEAVAESALRLCEADKAFILRFDGKLLHPVVAYNASPELTEFMRQNPIRPGRGSGSGRAALERRTVHIPDVTADPEYTFGSTTVDPVRTVLTVPMLKGAELLGVILIYRLEVRPFTEKQIALVETFADQAAIAIENVRLFDELRQRTDDLTESLQQQTATADVLKVISRSTFDLQTVLDTLTESAARLCEAEMAAIIRQKGTANYWATSYGLLPEIGEYVKNVALEPGRGSVVGRILAEGKTVHVPDVLADPEYEFLETQKKIGYRSMLGVPLLREGMPIGIVLLMRRTVQSFTDKQIELATTFADQALIAIENVRLFDELKARTEDLAESLQRQTATADVLKVISRSTFDLNTVLDTLLRSAARLCDADQGTITQRKGDLYYRSVTFGFPPEFTEYVKDKPVEPKRNTGVGRALLEGKVIHIPDTEADSEYDWAEAQRLGNFRTMLGVPMLREGVPVGVLALTRCEVNPFTDKQIELVTTFADQAAIAIENVRLFDEVQARTAELSRSLEDLQTAQDRLVQTEKLASLGQLTAGIAHEIKNPLNFVNNFSAVSVELIDEMRETMQGIQIDEKRRAEINELTDMLRDNLDKVVQHGKRADAIVKNMLLHSRQGSGEHRPVDINAIVEESLNLAYHGARAEKQGFNITLERSLDPTAGEVDVFPQEITRVLLNLISNGFYAATKRKVEANGGNYEPTLAAMTKNLGDSVEIRIRDNGTGIPPEVKEMMFNPFFTTKPVGEGTGLGLSLSYDIIVKQHGGSIEVDTQPGAFTEFRIVLPRGAATIAKSGVRA
jgi:two-component system NtrC family sensor kinase